MNKLEKHFPPYDGPFMDVLSPSESGIAPKTLSLNLLDVQSELPREVLRWRLCTQVHELQGASEARRESIHGSNSSVS